MANLNFDFNFRAVYQNKEIYVIDDIFSAVDVPVGIKIYKNVIMGLLKEKTRILCTHHPRFLTSANKVSCLTLASALDNSTKSPLAQIPWGAGLVFLFSSKFNFKIGAAYI